MIAVPINISLGAPFSPSNSLAISRFWRRRVPRVDRVVDQNRTHIFAKRGVFYFSRQAPKSLQPQFDRARSDLPSHALGFARPELAAALSAQLEMVWAQMRLESVLRRVRTLALTLPQMAAAGPSVKLSEAGDLYRRLKGGGKGKGFRAYTDRHLGYVVEYLGNAAISDLKRTDAGRFRDFLIAIKLTTSSAKRVFATVRAAVNLTISKYGLECTNPFPGTFTPEVGTKIVRPPIPRDIIRSVQSTCMEWDADNRLFRPRGSRHGDAPPANANPPA